MVPYNYAAIRAVQTLQAQEAEMKRQCEEEEHLTARRKKQKNTPPARKGNTGGSDNSEKGRHAVCGRKEEERLTARHRQETLKIVEVQERADEYNQKFVEDIEKDKVLLGNYKKSLEDHSEKLQESVKKEYQELDEKVAGTANQEGSKSDLKELERLLKLRKRSTLRDPAPDSKAHGAKQIRQTMNKFGFGVKRTQDLEEFQKAIAAQVKQADNETATSFEQAVEICGTLGHSRETDVGYGMRYL
ncbi:hypothetical protein CRE_20602 [Caenorhabditis remanei]|uniref:Uncharacterized protein n=1 Tax=Caenorhabditis remanei TaxID=31234 RepID=E3NKV2_CAERE|nr:hypothetical protein CRE_20602 [Caenorhabditis remanei]